MDGRSIVKARLQGNESDEMRRESALKPPQIYRVAQQGMWHHEAQLLYIGDNGEKKSWVAMAVKTE